jgi:predicted Zn-ribbon and HTH transcriptional regulator
MIKSKWQEYKEKGGTTPLDLFNLNIEKVSDEIKESRMSICLSCPELLQTTKQCKKCGCFMQLKTQLKPSKCPIGKW